MVVLMVDLSLLLEAFVVSEVIKSEHFMGLVLGFFVYVDELLESFGASVIA